MNGKVNIVLFGVGAVSSLIAKALLQKNEMEIIGAVDLAEDKVGKDLGDILGLQTKLHVNITKDISETFREVKPDIVVHATSSSLKQVYPQISECIRKEVNVVSTCEELAYPYMKHKMLADKLDKLAKQYEVSILGTGINPGFLMDTLPITMTGPCLEVNRIKVTRMMNSSKRRIPYQMKVGTGLTVDEFRAKIANKEITGHVGLDISISMIADTLGWRLDEIIESPPEPVLTDKKIETGYRVVKKGYVAGLESLAYGAKDGKKILELKFISHADVEEEYDLIEITGVPNITVKIEGGIHGDIGTTAMIVNSIPKVINASPGLHTMRSLPIPSILQASC